MSRLGFRRLLIGAAIGLTGFAGTAPIGLVNSSAGTVTRYAPGKTGVVSPVHGHPAGAQSATHASTREHGSLPTHQTPRAGTATRSTQATAAEAPLTKPTTVLHNFNGTSSRDSGVTNFNQFFEPPDQGLCVGNNFVLEPVNSAYRFFRPDGTTVSGPFNVNDLFNVGSLEFTSDPRCYFDASTNTWFAVILFINSSGTGSSLLVAVNPSGDPTNVWTEYQIDTTNSSGPGCPCFGDQPTLGIDQFNLYVTTNEFSILGPQFNGAQIYAISKADLVATLAAHFGHFTNLNIGGTQAASVQPALSTGTPSAEFFLNSLDPNGTFDNRVGVWAMTDREAINTGDSPLLSSTVITTEPYGVPPKAEQKGSTSVLDSGDDRMQQTQFIGGNIWGELTTAVTIPNDPAERAGAAWFDVHPTLGAGGLISTASLVHQGYVVKSGNYVIYPSLQADANGNAGMGFTLSGSSRFPSSAYATLVSGQPSFGSIHVSATGSGPYDAGAHRWGDYSWAVLDPSNSHVVWFANEYMPPVSSQTPNGENNWGTRVVEVTIS
jgi:hypothetical protein